MAQPPGTVSYSARAYIHTVHTITTYVSPVRARGEHYGYVVVKHIAKKQWRVEEGIEAMAYYQRILIISFSPSCHIVHV